MNNYTDCAIDFTANYCGSDHKRSINCRNECYMLKIADKSRLSPAGICVAELFPCGFQSKRRCTVD